MCTGTCKRKVEKKYKFRALYIDRSPSTAGRHRIIRFCFVFTRNTRLSALQFCSPVSRRSNLILHTDSNIGRIQDFFPKELLKQTFAWLGLNKNKLLLST